MFFKYLPPERTDCLTNLTIRFTPFTSLNDPYEFSSIIDIDELEDDLCRRFDDKFLHNIPTEHPAHSNPLEYKKLRSEAISPILKEFDPSIASETIRNLLSDNYGVLSLSRTNLNLLMWAHYAKDYTGYIIGFEDNHNFFYQPDQTGKTTSPLSVIYSELIPKLNPKDPSTSTYAHTNLMNNKPLDWAYEQEIRIARSYMDTHLLDTGTKDTFGNRVLLSPIPKDAIRKIFLGPRSSKETKLQILNAVKEKEIECKIYQGHLSKTEYKIQFTEITFDQ